MEENLFQSKVKMYTFWHSCGKVIYFVEKKVHEKQGKKTDKKFRHEILLISSNISLDYCSCKIEYARI